jgi:hypothetical protein
MLTKWKIDLPNMELYRFGEDKELYRLPFSTDKKSFGLRKLRKSRGCWLLNGTRWSVDQLRPHIIPDDNKKLLFKSEEMPF